MVDNWEDPALQDDAYLSKDVFALFVLEDVSIAVGWTNICGRGESG